MHSSNKDNRTINLFSQICDASDGLVPGLPLEYANSTVRCCEDVHSEGVLSCKHPYRDEFINEGRGYDLNNKIILGLEASLPIYIPIATRDVKYLPLHLPHSYIGVTLKDLYPRASRKRYDNWDFISGTTPDYDFALSLVFSTADKILFYSGLDLLIEGMNRDKYYFPLYDQLKNVGVTISTTPDFSVNHGSCTFGQVVNTNRTLAVGEEMGMRGIRAIPNVFAVHPYLLDMWLSHLNNNQDTLVISINCQRQRRSKEDMENLNWYVKELAGRSVNPIHIVLHGYPFNKEYLDEIKPYACQIHFADTTPFCLAMRGRKYHVYNRTRKKLIAVTEASRDPQVLCNMIEMSIQAREEYLRDVFYNGMVCDSNAFTNLSVVV